MRGIGIHIRCVDSLLEVADRAQALQVPFFQSFLISKTTGRILWQEPAVLEQFALLRREHFEHLYIHGSYWINLASVISNDHKALTRELSLGKRLGYTHMVLHAGSAKGGSHKRDGIDAVARALNKLFKHEHEIKIILENSAHAGLSVGGDLQDFAAILLKLDQPEKLSFCIDTAHAYAYGYDIVTAASREAFIQMLTTTLGSDRISLIHLNDTNEKLGSRVDRHQAIGAGRIGQEALKAFCLDPALETIPLLLELPVLTMQEEQEMLTLVRGWHTGGGCN